MSRKLTSRERERFRILLMAKIDDELTTQESGELQQLLRTYPELEKEWNTYHKLKEVTNTMALKSPPKEVWDKYWINIYNRIERSIAWILVSIGAIILITWSLFRALESMLADTQLVPFVKIGILLALAGFVILIVSVLREKLIIRKTDPYKEIQR
ncbi:hypothetical protein GF337_01135 [candidate division KSB1 bacterium]|nr:hypothetical protein [candidate division KSB1 bacterium]